MSSLSVAQEDPDHVRLKPRTPFTYLFDTRAASAVALPARALEKKAGWATIPEDDLKHKFTGDAVFHNDKIAIVLRRNGPGAEGYSRTATGLRQRALLILCGPGADRATNLSSVTIIENNSGAVMLAAVYRTLAGKIASAGFRLTTGQIFLGVRASVGSRTLLIQGKTSYTVVPDFFADDMVFSAEAFDADRVGLPAEKLVLNLIEGGDAIVMCVWPSNEQNADVVFADDGRERTISGCEIECIDDKGIWVAFLESASIWHSRSLWEKDEGKDIALDWKPPFHAKWRGSIVREKAVSYSWNFRAERNPAYTFPGLGKVTYPCWFDQDRALVRIPRFRSADAPERAAESYPGLLVVYPLDRSRSTPLTLFCPIDIMRNTLGVGPCEYILAMEGIGSQTPATPEQVTRWVARQFKRNRDKRHGAEIVEGLSQMSHHIDYARQRIDDYKDLAALVRSLCVEEERDNGAVAIARKLRRIADDMQQSIELSREAMKTPAAARQLAGRIAALIGKENALADCERLGEQLRTIGTAQDYTLGKCRMAVRRIKQQCRMAARQPGAAELTGKVQKQAEHMLQKK